MKKIVLLSCLAVASVAMAQTASDDVARMYEGKMDSLQQERQNTEANASRQSSQVKLNPYFYRLMTPGTLYQSPTQQVFGVAEPSSAEEAATNEMLAKVYASNPSIIQRTEREIMQEPALRENISEPVESTSRLVESAVPVELTPDEVDAVEIEAQKPKFWTVKGNGTIQLTQSYFSENWYQGGETNYAVLGMITLDANYNNLKKLQWDNRLEAQLGYQTSNDEVHKYKATSNLLRGTSKVGYKAAKNWFYSGQALAYTQIVPNYKPNSHDHASCFASPLNLNIAVGMDYKFKTKNGKFSGSLFLAPIAYNMRYYGDLDLRAADKNIKEGKRAFHNFGPSFTLNYKWEICKNVAWESRLFYFTNMHYVTMEMENIFTFTINKYLTSKLFVYPRFEDSNVSTAYKAKDASGNWTDRRKYGYMMLKEWLSLGLSYNF